MLGKHVTTEPHPQPLKFPHKISVGSTVSLNLEILLPSPTKCRITGKLHHIHPLAPLFFHMVLEALARAIMQEEDINRRDGIKLSLFR
jgi:hypothetical protein